MPREVSLGAKVNSSKAVASIKELKQAFQELNKEINKNGKNGEFNIKVNLEGVDLKLLKDLSTGFSKLGKGMEKFNENIEKVTESGHLLNITTKNITNNLNKTSNSYKIVNGEVEDQTKAQKTLAVTLAKTAAAYKVLWGYTSNTFNFYRELTNATYAVGIAGQMSMKQIGGLNEGFLQLSTTVPKAASELALAVDGLIRTGRSYEDAYKIIKEVAILSTASGDDLKSTAGVVTKVMVSLGIRGDNVKDTLTTLHSVAIQTASDMNYLSGAFKSVAGTASVLVNSSGMAGKELDEYKQTVLDLNMSMIGALANMGISASEAGTKVKNLMSRLLSAEKVAKTMFNDTMKLNNIQVDGKLFNFDMLSQIAKTDLPRAIDLLSQLRKQGVLTDAVMTKMFTQRHGMDIAALLEQVNGSSEKFVANLAKGISYANDAKKQMFNVSEQLKLFMNNFNNIASMTTSQITDTATGVLMNINRGAASVSALLSDIATKTSALSNLSSAFTSISIGTTATAASIFSVVKALGLLKNAIPIIAATATTNPLTMMLVAVGGLFAYISKVQADAEKLVLDNNLLLSDNVNLIQQGLTQVNALNSRITSLQNLLGEVSGEAFNKDLTETTLLMDLILDKTKGLKQLVGNFQSINFVDITATKKQLEVLKDQADVAKRRMEEEQKNFNIIKQQYLFKGEAYGQDYSQVNVVRSLYLDNSNIANIDERVKATVEQATRQLDLSKGVIESMIHNFIQESDFTPFDKMLERLKEAKTVHEDIQTKVTATTAELEKQAEANRNNLQQIRSWIAESRLDTLLETNQVEIGGKLFKGWEGYTQLMVDKLMSNFTSSIEAQKDKITATEQALAELKMKSVSGLTQEDKARQEELLKSLEIDKAELKTREGIVDQVRQEYLWIVKRNVELAKSKGLSMSIGAPDLTSVIEVQADFQSKKALGQNVQALEKEVEEVTKSVIKKAEARQLKENSKSDNKTKYQLKHISLLNEELQLELEIAKIGSTKAKQAYLDYEYKLKTLQANKNIAYEEMKNVYRDTKNDYTAQSKEGVIFLKKALETNDPRQIVKLLNEFESKYKGIMVGEKGRKIKSDYDEIIKLLNAAKGFEKAGEKFKVEVMKGLSSIQDYMASTIYSELAQSQIKYRKAYTDSLVQEFKEKKQKVAVEFDLDSDFNLQKELEKSATKIDLLKTIGNNPAKLKSLKNNIIKEFGDQTYDSILGSNEELALLFSKEENLMKVLLELEKERAKYNKETTQDVIKRYDALSSVASMLTNLSTATGSPFFKNIGGVINSFKEAQKYMTNPNNSFSLNGLFNPSNFKDKQGNTNWDDYFANIDKLFTNMNKQFEQGGSIGTLIGGIFGGGASSQAAGGLAGLVTGALGVGGLSGIGVQIGASLLGGLFDRGGKDQAKAEQKTREANKLYSANTEALQKLSQNMSSLSGGVDGLNNSLISAFSKIPTVGNLNRVTDAMTSLYKTMDKTRIFNDVAYQVTKTKKKKGFLGIGGGSTSWTETYELSVQEMLNRYGFKGTIEDMTTEQMRAFSKWLKNYDIGESDNFSVLGDAISEYAEALDKMDKKVESFFYDATMEGFEGISSIQQAELKQQITDFYKNLGLTIDDDMSKQIDQLAEQMSIMVNIMGDVRGNFINTWKDSGMDAGKAFLSSMQPYIQAMLTNLSQIYYDVYFSDVNKQLEDTFKDLSNQLVELKKQGNKLNWDNVANELSGSFDKVLDTLRATKIEATSFNDILLKLQKQALDSGMSLSEIFDLGLVTGTQKTVIDSFKTALTSGEADGTFTSLGSSVGEKIGDALVNKLIDSMMGEKVLEMSAQLDKVMSGNLNIESLTGLANDAMGVGLMLEQQRLRFDALLDMFNWDTEITYENQNSNIKYETGTSQSVINNYYLSSNIDAGNVIEADSLERLADSLLDILIEKLKVDKGIIL